jgi:hypothetical protein
VTKAYPRLQLALAYASRGWRVLPLWWPVAGHCACPAGERCPRPAKHPHPLVPRGVHDASCDPASVRRWWSAAPQANLGLATGRGLLVLDVDGETGQASLRRLVAEHGQLRAAWTRTGSGGWHAWLALPPGAVAPNSVRRLGPGLDTRGDGGYVVAPPSRHASGGVYAWLRGEPPEELPPAPSWLLQLLRPPAPPPPPPRPLGPSLGSRQRYALAALDAEAARVALTPPGQRNSRLFLAAARCGELVAAGALDEATVTSTLARAGQAAGLAPHEIAATIRSGLRHGGERPRRVPA